MYIMRLIFVKLYIFIFIRVAVLMIKMQILTNKLRQ